MASCSEHEIFVFRNNRGISCPDERILVAQNVFCSMGMARNISRNNQMVKKLRTELTKLGLNVSMTCYSAQENVYNCSHILE
jgi:hypothetical protein